MTIPWISDAERNAVQSWVNDHADRMPLGEAKLIVQCCVKTLAMYLGATNQTQSLASGSKRTRASDLCFSLSSSHAPARIGCTCIGRTTRHRWGARREHSTPGRATSPTSSSRSSSTRTRTSSPGGETITAGEKGVLVEFSQVFLLAVSTVREAYRQKTRWRHLHPLLYPWMLEHAHGPMMNGHVADEVDFYMALAFKPAPAKFHIGAIFQWQTGQVQVAVHHVMFFPPIGVLHPEELHTVGLCGVLGMETGEWLRQGRLPSP